MIHVGEAILLVIIGAVAGAANTLASAGSALTLPLLLFFHLAPAVANGTNHVAVFVGSITRIGVFAKSGKLDWGNSLVFAAAATAGALVGSRLSIYFTKSEMNSVILAAVIAALAVLLAHPKKFMRTESEARLKKGAFQILMLFLVGIWAGLILIDCGTYLLLVLTLGVGYSLMQAVAVKSVIVFFTMFVSCAFYIMQGNVLWDVAAYLAAGSLVGSWVAAKFALREKSRTWIYRIVIFLLVFEIGHMIFLHFSRLG